MGPWYWWEYENDRPLPASASRSHKRIAQVSPRAFGVHLLRPELGFGAPTATRICARESSSSSPLTGVCLGKSMSQ